ncbi:MAG: GumC family protein [Bdellovibrionales bacterium]
MENLTLHDYLVILKRQKKYFLLTFLIVWIGFFVFALCWSNYRSTATVEIEQPQVATGMTMPAGMSETLADLRISKIQQKVTAPPSLIDIISKFNLYPGPRKVTPVATIASRMRGAIKLDLVSSTVANPAAAQKVSAEQLSAIAFVLSFDYSDPQTAQQVTNEIVSRFLDEDLKQRRAEAEETSAFLATQIAALENSMLDQERKIAQFEHEHGASRPESLMFNQQAAATTIMSLQSLDSQITANEGTQGALRAQLMNIDPYSRVIADGQVLTTPATQLKALEAQYTTLTAQYGPDHPDVVKARNQIEALRSESGQKKNSDTGQLNSQIVDARTQLAAARKTYGPKSPDVAALQRKLKTLEDRLAAAGKGASNQGVKHDADNPAYLGLIAQLRSAEEQHKALLIQREQLAAQQAKYQRAVAENPVLAQQMAALTRDYDNAQLRYRELKERKMAADMDVQMVQERKGQRLVVINPPDLPVKTHPSRLMIILAGFIAAMGCGIGSVVLAQAMSRSIVGPQHLSSIVGVPPLVTIPHLYTRREASRALRMRPYAIAGFAFLVIITGVVFNYAIIPVDVLWSMFAQRLGLS